MCIDGAYFGDTQGIFVVRFGKVIPKVLKWSKTWIEIVCPKLLPGRYRIHLEKNGKDVTFYSGYFKVVWPKIEKK